MRTKVRTIVRVAYHFRILDLSLTAVKYKTDLALAWRKLSTSSKVSSVWTLWSADVASERSVTRRRSGAVVRKAEAVNMALTNKE
jgi:hypothetical protein